MKPNSDFVFYELGGQVLLKPLTAPARRWLVENAHPSTPYIGAAAVVPWSAIGPVLEAIDRAGLVVVQTRS